jgi:hypothetical protein
VKIYVAAMEVLRKKERLSLPPKLMVFWVSALDGKLYWDQNYSYA